MAKKINEGNIDTFLRTFITAKSDVRKKIIDKEFDGDQKLKAWSDQLDYMQNDLMAYLQREEDRLKKIHKAYKK